MAFENLILRQTRKIRAVTSSNFNIGGALQFDGVIQEATTLTNRVTNFPVENGNVIADHVIREPMTISVQGVFTDTPLGLEAFTEGLTGVTDNETGLLGTAETTGQTRSQQAYSVLVEMFERREFVELQTGLKKYRNLVFESVSVTQDKDTSRSVFFTATFKEVLLVKSALKSLDKADIAEPTDKAGLANTEFRGSAPKVELTDAQNRTAFRANSQGL